MGDGQNKNARFVREVVQAYGDRLHRFLMKRIRAGEDAEDVAQQVYERLLRLNRTDLIKNPEAYVYFIADQIIGTQRLAKARCPTVYDSAVVERLNEERPSAAADDLQESEHMRRQLSRMLAKLSAVQREALLLRKCDGLSVPEIARTLRLSEHQVKRALHTANATLSKVKPEGW